MAWSSVFIMHRKMFEWEMSKAKVTGGDVERLVRAWPGMALTMELILIHEDDGMFKVIKSRIPSDDKYLTKAEVLDYVTRILR